MSDQPTPLYRGTVEPANIGRDGDERPLVLQEALDIGALVLVEPCEHGNIDPHRIFESLPFSGENVCPGAGIGDNDEPA